MNKTKDIPIVAACIIAIVAAVMFAAVPLSHAGTARILFCWHDDLQDTAKQFVLGEWSAPSDPASSPDFAHPPVDSVLTTTYFDDLDPTIKGNLDPSLNLNAAWEYSITGTGIVTLYWRAKFILDGHSSTWSNEVFKEINLLNPPEGLIIVELGQNLADIKVYQRLATGSKSLKFYYNGG